MLFPILLSSLISSIKADWTNIPGIIAGFHSVPDTIIQKGSSTKTLFLSQQIDDVYRKIINKAVGTAVFRQKTSLYVYFPYSMKNSSQSLTFLSAFPTLKGNNLNDETAVHFNLIERGVDNSLIWTLYDGTGFLGIGLRFADRRINGDIDILDFPTSRDETLNEYFLDLLPATFGATADMSNHLMLSAVTLSASTKIPGHRLQLTFNHQNTENNLAFHYINSSATPTLSGKRLLEIPVKLRQNRISAILSPEQSIIAGLSLDLFKTNLDFSTDYHTYDAVDMDDLGGGQFARTGAAFLITGDFADNSFSVGISGVQYIGDFTIKTPLLGYAADPLLGIPIIPVAHWAEAKIGQGRSTAQLIDWSKNIRFPNTIFDLGLRYIRSYYRFQLQGKAHLEFGLTSAPIDYPVTISANMFILNANIHHYFKYFSVFYSGKQIIPFIERTDNSPIKIHEPVAGKNIRQRGGQSHQIGIEYKF